jgi:DNA-binding Lrp family transcriptional regulator
MDLDEIDRKIIGAYIDDARQSYHKVAKKVGVAVSTVQERTRKLEESGVIKGYTALLDYEKLGLSVTAVTEVTTTGGKLAEVEQKLATMPQASAVYDVAGATDCIVLGKFKSTGELSKFCKAIQSIPHVNRTETHIVLSLVKEELPKF